MPNFWKNTCVWSAPVFTVEVLKSSVVRVKCSMNQQTGRIINGDEARVQVLKELSKLLHLDK